MISISQIACNKIISYNKQKMRSLKLARTEQDHPKFIKSTVMDNQTECPICLQQYDLLRITPMMICFNQHSSCQKCLRIVYSKRRCPICSERLIQKEDVRKNRLVCSMLQEMFKGNGQILLYTKSYTYKGELKNGKRHGFGEQYTSQGSYLKGNFVDGELNGKCQVITKNGAKFSGQAINGRLQGTFTTKYGSIVEGNFDIQGLSGPNCTKRYTNGDVYEGMIRGLKADGFGKLTFSNGNVMEGNFVKDYIESDTKATIKGTFLMEIIDGQLVINQINQQIQRDDLQNSSYEQNPQSESESQSQSQSQFQSQSQSESSHYYSQESYHQ